MKKIFIKELKENVKRNGIENLIQFLEDSDFFKAPASTKFHGAKEGGLLEHSFQVYELLIKKNTNFLLNTGLETMTIVGLLHDICKANFYVKDNEAATQPQLTYLNRLTNDNYTETTKAYASKLIEHYKNGGVKENEPEYIDSYKIDDKLPFGHGEKSVYILNKFIPLTDEEALAIRWHMGPFEPGVALSTTTNYTFNSATKRFPLIVALFCADYESSKILNK